MQSSIRRLLLAFVACVSLVGWLGCRTVGTAGRSAGEAAGDTARAAGKAAGTAAEGAGDIIHDTAGAAEDELD
jgi:hypothetical protein